MRLPALLDATAPVDAWPDPATALDHPPGLLAVGGDLSVPRLVSAYRNGVFPWFSEGDPILWWSPPMRMVFDQCRVHVGRTLRRILRDARFHISFDTAFDDVVVGCADRPAGTGTWITASMRAAYNTLHDAGHAHSVEVWRDDELVGGLYGVALGTVFFGESMFSRVDDASKVALVTLATRLDPAGFTMIDGQLPNPHLQSLGAVSLPRDRFLERLRQEADPARRCWERVQVE